MPLPFRPESLESLQARYPQALARIWDISQIEAGWDRLALHQEHLFDCEDGMRLLITLDRANSGVVFEHVSASLSEQGTFYDWLKSCPSRVRFLVFMEHALEWWSEISRKTTPVEFIGFSPAHVPHWAVRVDESETPAVH